MREREGCRRPTLRLAGVVLFLAATLPGVGEAARLRPIAPVLSGAAIAPSQARLTWTASGPAAIGYNVLIDGRPAHHMLTDDGVARSVVVHNLRASTSYVQREGLRRRGRLLAVEQPCRRHDTGRHRHGRADGLPVAEMVPSVWYPGAPDHYTTLRHLVPGTTHRFTVRARDESDNRSPPSNEVTFALPPSSDVTPSTAPVITFATNWANCGFFDLSWNASVDDVDAWHQIDYEIYADGVFIGIWLDQVHEGAFGRHRYHIRGVDRRGNASPPSNEVVLDHGLGC